MTEYLVVLKADANARFRRPEQSMTFRAVVDGVPHSVTFYSRFTDEGLDAAVPRELLAECRTEAESIDAAIASLGTAAAGLANLTAFVTNAAVGPMSLHVAVDASPGLSARQFAQEFGQFDSGPVQQGRAIPVDEVGAVARLIGAAEHLEAGWTTATQHYALALTRWRLGSEPFALTHLYTAAEGLEKTIRLQEADRQGVPPDELHTRLPMGTRREHVGAYYRRHVVFQGDSAFMDAVRKVSDNLEHGSANVMEAQAEAVELAPRLFRLVRECMLSLIQTPQAVRDHLLGEKYGSPLDPTLRKVVIGEMIDLPGQMGPPGFAYPYLTWDSGLSSLAFDDAGELQASLAENFRVHTAEGGGFTLRGLRMYGRRADQANPPVEMKDVKVTFGPGRPEAE